MTMCAELAGLHPKSVRRIVIAVGLALDLVGGLAHAQTCPSWTERHPPGMPPSRDSFAMAYDSARKRLVVTGGFVGPPYDNGSFIGGTWEFDATTWFHLDPQVDQRRIYANMVYDERRHVCVLFGGTTNFILSPSSSDTLEWNGQNWTLRTPAQSPPPREVFGMTYDSARGVSVVFGGFQSNENGTEIAALGDTWEWDGNNWTQRNTGGPSPRDNVAMAFDGTRRVTVLFGGAEETGTAFLTDTWEWDGNAWSPRSTDFPLLDLVNPPIMAFDEARGALLLFTRSARREGSSGTTVALVYDTRSWDGNTWTLRDSYEIPAAQDEYEEDLMTYDDDRGIVVRFGGLGFTDASHLWEWPGGEGPTIAQQPTDQTVSMSEVAEFHVETTSNSPIHYQWRFGGVNAEDYGPTVTRGAHSSTLTIDASTQMPGFGQNAVDVIVSDDCGSTISEPASWTVTEHQYWTDVTSQLTAMPSPRKGHAMAYDSTRHRTVLFGGNENTTHNGETWEYDGVNWNLVANTGPAPRSGLGLSYGPIDGAGHMGIVLFGGEDNDFYLGDTWVWDGHTWRAVVPAAFPGTRAGHSMAYDPNLNRVIMFGGANSGGYFGDTWEWDGTNWNLANTGTISGTAPSPRDQHVMVYNPVRGRVMLYGGDTFDNLHAPYYHFFTDTWEWHGETDRWVKLSDTGPANSLHPFIAFDGARNELRMFGGYGDDGFITDENPWTYVWHEPSKAWISTDGNGPPARDEGTMVYDEQNEFIVLFGGWDRYTLVSTPFGVHHPIYGDTWHYRVKRPEVRQLTLEGSAQACDYFRIGLEGYSPPDMPLGYQWRKNTEDISPFTPGIFGANTDTLTINKLVPSDSGVYDARVFNNECSILNESIDLHVIPPHVQNVDVATTPGSGVAQVCSIASLTANVTGVPIFHYQWMRGELDLFNRARISGTTSQTLTLGPLLFAQGGNDYRVRAWNDCAPADNRPSAGFQVVPKPWTAVSSSGPAARNSQAMAYDSRRGVTVLYGGLTPNSSTYNGETWEWNGNTWIQGNVSGPGSRAGANMAYDIDRGVCVLFGGSSAPDGYPGAFLNDTWEWDGNLWTQRTTVGAPPVRSAYGMAYDSVAKRIVMYGGWVGFPLYQYLHDTWEYDGVAGTWTQVSTGLPDPSPGNYNSIGAMAYDSARNKRYAFNAYIVPGDIYQWGLHTFEWDGTQWVRIFPQNDLQYGNPGNYRGGAGLAYHAGRHMIIWNNGAYAFTDPVQVTWGFDGSAWHFLSGGEGPSHSASGAIAYDSARNAIVQFGGGGPWGMSPPDTWELVDADEVKILRQPRLTSIEQGETATFSITTRGAPLISYRWHYNGVDLTDGPRISGAHSGILTISNVSFADSGDYRAVVSNGCGSVTSSPSRLQVPVSLFGDGDLDGDVDLADYDLMWACATGPDFPLRHGCEPFDYDNDGDVDLADEAAFQRAIHE
ncbi:MAG: immunoglobulin domain-containing protein [Planctomycetes bacterium]|nr:immunoglobulin domain-containing protein [Planctomycetota bacterium]